MWLIPRSGLSTGPHNKLTSGWQFWQLFFWSRHYTGRLWWRRRKPQFQRRHQRPSRYLTLQHACNVIAVETDNLMQTRNIYNRFYPCSRLLQRMRVTVCRLQSSNDTETVATFRRCLERYLALSPSVTVSRWHTGLSVSALLCKATKVLSQRESHGVT